MKKIILLITIIFVFVSCANKVDVSECISNDTYGFWGGLWHGITAPISFFGSLFFDIAVYSPDNNGNWYSFGFVLGSGILGFGTSKSTK